MTGRAIVRYDCDARFDGSLRYGSVVRALARLKGVTLVTVLEGDLGSAQPWDCAASGGSFSARLSLHETVLKGHIIAKGDSISVDGRAWHAGGAAFHGELTAEGDSGGYTLRVSLREHAR